MVTNRYTLAARLRRLANQLDRAAWQAEMAGLAVKARDIPAGPLIAETRQIAQHLRRVAETVRPARRTPK